MKFFFILLLVFSCCDPKFCLEEDFAKLRVICTVSDDTVPITEKEDLSLDELCSDVLYKVSLKKQSFYWENALNISNPVSSFRNRHPNLRLHISVDDSFLETKSLSEATPFISFLRKMNSSGLDVIVNPQTNLAVLSLVLLNYQQILFGNFLELSITVDSRVDINLMVEHGIQDLVDNIFYLPNNIISKDNEDMSITNVYGLSTNKLVIGLSSVVFVVPNSEDRSKIPSFNELCNGSNLNQWKPRIQPDDQVMWKHSEKKWKFAMQMGLAVTNQMNTIHPNNSRAGILLFDVSFRIEDNPICSRHKTLFIDSLLEAIGGHGFGNNRKRRVKRDPTEPLSITTKPQVKLIEEDSRLGKVLVFAVGDEDEQFRKYYRIHDKDLLLQSPVDHIILGYDDSGKIYDLYQPMPRELSHESILNTIRQYYVDKILGGGGGNTYGAVQLQPPNILVYPSGNHPVPILVTWVRVASPVVRLMPRKTRKQFSTTTSSTTSIPSTTHRMCTDSQNPFQRCFIPVGLMEILNSKSRPSTTTTTRKSTAMRQTTTKPLVPMNPYARADDSIDASLHVTTLAAPEVTIPSLQSTLPLPNKQDSKLLNSRMANPSKKQILCNRESPHSHFSCKTRNRRFVNTQLKRSITKHSLQYGRAPADLSEEKKA